MGKKPANTAVRSGRVYRVILECIDPTRETPASFAIKLSMRVRTPLPRVKQVLRNLPYCLKSGLSINQATRWKGILQELGATARVVEQSTGGVATPTARAPEGPKLRSEAEARDDGATRAANGIKVCEYCGSEEGAIADFCGFCFKPFPQRREDDNVLESEPPDHNPFSSRRAERRESDGEGNTSFDIVRVWRDNKPAVLLAAVVVLLILLLLK